VGAVESGCSGKHGRFSGAVSAVENCYGRKFDFFEFLFRENFEGINSVVTGAALVSDKINFVSIGSKFKRVYISFQKKHRLSAFY
jgi:hypothetical protein